MREQAYNEGTAPRLSRVILVWSAVGVLALSLSLGTKMIRPVWRGLSVSAAIVQGRARLEQQRLDNAALKAELAFLRSDEGKRWATWYYLGMAPPGWEAGRVVEQVASPPPPTRPQRIQAWLRAVRERSAQRVRMAGDILMVYCGRQGCELGSEVRNVPTAGLSKSDESGGSDGGSGDGDG